MASPPEKPLAERQREMREYMQQRRSERGNLVSAWLLTDEEWEKHAAVRAKRQKAREQRAEARRSRAQQKRAEDLVRKLMVDDRRLWVNGAGKTIRPIPSGPPILALYPEEIGAIYSIEGSVARLVMHAYLWLLVRYGRDSPPFPVSKETMCVLDAPGLTNTKVWLQALVTLKLLSPAGMRGRSPMFVFGLRLIDR